MTTLTTYALRLPKSIKTEAEKLSKADGTSLNQFVALAVAEKISALKTAAFFEERIARARQAQLRGEPSALAAALARTDGAPPREGDELPEGFVRTPVAAPTVARPVIRTVAKRGATATAQATRKTTAKAASPARRKA